MFWFKSFTFREMQSGSACLEACITLLPLMSMFICFVALMLWLAALPLVTRDAILATAAATATVNRTNNAQISFPTLEDTLINHPDSGKRDEAASHARNFRGYIDSKPFHVSCYNQLAGTIARRALTGKKIAVGLTNEPSERTDGTHYVQVGIQFTPQPSGLSDLVTYTLRLEGLDMFRTPVQLQATVGTLNEYIY